MERTSNRNLWIGFGILALLAFVALPMFGGTIWGRYGYGFGEGVHPFVGGPAFWGFWGLGALVRLLFLGALIFFIVSLFLRRRHYWDHDHDESGTSDLTPTEILRRRYAAGEITRQQYEQMLHDLEAPSASTA